MSDTARVIIEEAQLGELRWGVFIERPASVISKTVWGRYGTQSEAQGAAIEARAYLASPDGHDECPTS